MLGREVKESMKEITWADESLNLHGREEGVEWECSDSSEWLSEFAFFVDLPAELMERNTTYEQTKMTR